MRSERLLARCELLFALFFLSCTRREESVRRDASVARTRRVVLWPAPDRSALYRTLAQTNPTAAARLQQSATRNQHFLELVRTHIERDRSMVLVSVPETQNVWNSCPTQEPDCLRAACRRLQAQRCVNARVLDAQEQCHAMATIETAPFNGAIDNDHATFHCAEEELEEAAQQLARRILGRTNTSLPDAH